MKNPNRTFYLAFSAILLALLIICAQIVLPLPMIPLTLQPLGVGMIGTLLPLPWAGATILAYLALGAIGLPVFAGAHGGIAAFLTPSGGYLPSFFVYAVLAALFLRNRQKTWINIFVANVCAAMIYLVLGSLWLCLPFIAGMSVKAALIAGTLPFALPVIGEIAVYTTIATALHKVMARRLR